MKGWELEVFKAVLSLGLLALGWFLGQRVVAYWDVKKKRSELDMAAAQRFFELYGEFKAINRLWNTFCFNKHPELSQKNRAAGKTLIEIPDADEVRWELLKRAAAAESGVESLVLKLASERSLGEEQLRALGQFRQDYQKLREAIRTNEPLGWRRGDKAYDLFNEDAATFAQMISLDRAPERPPVEEARANMKAITSYGSKQSDEPAKEGPARAAAEISRTVD